MEFSNTNEKPPMFTFDVEYIIKAPVFGNNSSLQESEFNPVYMDDLLIKTCEKE